MSEKPSPRPRAGSEWVHRCDGYRVIVDGVNADDVVRHTEVGMLIVRDTKVDTFHRAYRKVSR